MKPAIILLLLTALGGCQTGATLTRCGGKAFGLNPSHWEPSKADIKVCSGALRNN